MAQTQARVEVHDEAQKEAAGREDSDRTGQVGGDIETDGGENDGGRLALTRGTIFTGVGERRRWRRRVRNPVTTAGQEVAMSMCSILRVLVALPGTSSAVDQIGDVQKLLGAFFATRVQGLGMPFASVFGSMSSSCVHLQA